MCGSASLGLRPRVENPVDPVQLVYFWERAPLLPPVLVSRQSIYHTYLGSTYLYGPSTNPIDCFYSRCCWYSQTRVCLRALNKFQYALGLRCILQIHWLRYWFWFRKVSSCCNTAWERERERERPRAHNRKRVWEWDPIVRRNGNSEMLPLSGILVVAPAVRWVIPVSIPNQVKIQVDSYPCEVSVFLLATRTKTLSAESDAGRVVCTLCLSCFFYAQYNTNNLCLLTTFTRSMILSDIRDS